MCGLSAYFSHVLLYGQDQHDQLQNTVTDVQNYFANFNAQYFAITLNNVV